MNELSQQIQQLEMLVTEHERVLEQYSELFRDHQSQIDRLVARIKQLEQKVSENLDNNDAPAEHEPPPHY